MTSSYNKMLVWGGGITSSYNMTSSYNKMLVWGHDVILQQDVSMGGGHDVILQQDVI